MLSLNRCLPLLLTKVSKHSYFISLLKLISHKPSTLLFIYTGCFLTVVVFDYFSLDFFHRPLYFLRKTMRNQMGYRSKLYQENKEVDEKNRVRNKVAGRITHDYRQKTPYISLLTAVELDAATCNL